MDYRQLRKLHRWIFNLAGIFIVIWLLSGVLMVMPAYWFGPTANHQNPPADFRRAAISPAEAIVRMEQRTSQPAKVANVQLRQINDVILYAIRLDNGEEQLVNATTGEIFAFTPALAEDIIRRDFKVKTPLADIRRLDGYERDYPWGSLPVYRLRFEGDGTASYYVAEKDLRVTRSSTLTRVRAAITSLHEFEPVKLISDNAWARRGLLIAIGAIGLTGALIGVWMTLPLRRRIEP